MNFYRRFIGDYSRDTGHLSLAHHGAYTLLLDAYYATEKPLPIDYVALYRIARAHGPAEQRAVREVADEFFPVSDGARRNKRADRQLPDEQARIQTARENGSKGGRRKQPPRNPAGSQEVSQQVTDQDTQRANSPSPSPSGLTSLTPLPPTPRRGAAADKPPEENTPRRSGAWRSSEAGIKAKAREVGIGEARPGEDWQAYIRRVADAAERHAQEAA